VFSAFFLVNGGGRLRQYGRLRNKPLLFAYGDKALRPQRLAEILAAAKAGGTILTAHAMKGVGHAFPASECPAVRAWVTRVASGLAR
jgi:hypothetical protein